jgi:hypothetical protein
MHPALEKLIDLTLVDGQLTDKERAVIFKKAEELGVDMDEVEILIEAKLHQSQQSSAPQRKEKLGNIKTCPACGEMVKSMEINCSSCGHEFSNVQANKTISKLLEEIKALKKGDDLDADENYEEQKANLINSIPIPTSKEDLLEFLTVCTTQANVGFMQVGNGKVHTAWTSRGEEALLKARITMKDDKTALAMLDDFEKKLNKTKKELKYFYIIIFVLLGLIASGWFLK